MKILIAVPTFENIEPDTFRAIYNMKRGDHQVDFDFVRGYDCAKARNVAAKKAINGGYDFLMMIDSDTVPPDDALLNMLEYPADVVLGCCPRKNTKKQEVVLYSADKDNYRKMLTYPDLPDKPWFKYVLYDNADALSEDLYFCSQVRNAGMRIEADTRVRCGHIMKHIAYE